MLLSSLHPFVSQAHYLQAAVWITANVSEIILKQAARPHLMTDSLQTTNTSSLSPSLSLSFSLSTLVNWMLIWFTFITCPSLVTLCLFVHSFSFFYLSILSVFFILSFFLLNVLLSSVCSISLFVSSFCLLSVYPSLFIFFVVVALVLLLNPSFCKMFILSCIHLFICLLCNYLVCLFFIYFFCLHFVLIILVFNSFVIVFYACSSFDLCFVSFFSLIVVLSC